MKTVACLLSELSLAGIQLVPKKGKIEIYSSAKSLTLKMRQEMSDNKAELTHYLETDSKLNRIYQKALAHVESFYVLGTLPHIEKSQSEILEESYKTEEKMNDIWLSVREGQSNIDNFVSELRYWIKLQEEMQQLYLKSKGRERGSYSEPVEGLGGIGQNQKQNKQKGVCFMSDW